MNAILVTPNPKEGDGHRTCNNHKETESRIIGFDLAWIFGHL